MAKLMQKVIMVPCKSNSSNGVKEALKEILSEANFPKTFKELLCFGILDAVRSMARYAADRSSQNEISVTFDMDEVRFKTTIVDTCNIYELKEGTSEIEKKISKERGHKLSIPFLRTIMDEVIYTYRKGFENELVLVKFLP